MGGAFYAVQVPLLERVDPDDLAAAPIRDVDGRHDRFDGRRTTSASSKTGSNPAPTLRQ